MGSGVPVVGAAGHGLIVRLGSRDRSPGQGAAVSNGTPSHEARTVPEGRRDRRIGYVEALAELWQSPAEDVDADAGQGVEFLGRAVGVRHDRGEDAGTLGVGGSGALEFFSGEPGGLGVTASESARRDG